MAVRSFLRLNSSTKYGTLSKTFFVLSANICIRFRPRDCSVPLIGVHVTRNCPSFAGYLLAKNRKNTLQTAKIANEETVLLPAMNNFQQVKMGAYYRHIRYLQ